MTTLVRGNNGTHTRPIFESTSRYTAIPFPIEDLGKRIASRLSGDDVMGRLRYEGLAPTINQQPTPVSPHCNTPYVVRFFFSLSFYWCGQMMKGGFECALLVASSEVTPTRPTQHVRIPGHPANHNPAEHLAMLCSMPEWTKTGRSVLTVP